MPKTRYCLVCDKPINKKQKTPYHSYCVSELIKKIELPEKIEIIQEDDDPIINISNDKFIVKFERNNISIVL